MKRYIVASRREELTRGETLFLEDMAQITGLFDYKDIVLYDTTKGDTTKISKLIIKAKNIMREVLDMDAYELMQEDEEFQDIMHAIQEEILSARD